MERFTLWRQRACLLSLFFIIVSLFGIATKGLNLGLEFTGGYLFEFKIEQPIDNTLHTHQQVTHQRMQQAILSVGLQGARINSSLDEQRWSIRLHQSGESEFTQQHLIELSNYLNADVIVLDTVYIGGQVGADLLEKGGLALLVAMLAVLLYLAFRFEWRLALSALFALIHDVLIVLGVFAWAQITFDLSTMAALLAIIGYSLNDSIVIGDRIRELLNIRHATALEQIINMAINSTLSRTFVTSGTTLVTVSAIWFLAGQALHGFSLALFAGVAIGSISSITISATLPAFLGLRADYYHIQKTEVDSEL